MSWVHDNQEGWDGLERSAVARWLGSLRQTESTPATMEILEEIADTLQSEHSGVFHAMIRAGALPFLVDEEADYHGRQVDAAMALAEARN